MSDFVLNLRPPDVETKGILGLMHALEDVQAAADKLKAGSVPTKAQIEAIINAACVLTEEGQRDDLRAYLLTEATANDLVKLTSTITALAKPQ